MPQYNIKEFREKYPQYDEMADNMLASRLYQRHYKGKMSPQNFVKEFLGIETDTEKNVSFWKDFAKPAGKTLAKTLPMVAGSAGGYPLAGFFAMSSGVPPDASLKDRADFIEKFNQNIVDYYVNTPEEAKSFELMFKPFEYVGKGLDWMKGKAEGMIKEAAKEDWWITDRQGERLADTVTTPMRIAGEAATYLKGLPWLTSKAGKVGLGPLGKPPGTSPPGPPDTFRAVRPPPLKETLPRTLKEEAIASLPDRLKPGEPLRQPLISVDELENMQRAKTTEDMSFGRRFKERPAEKIPETTPPEELEALRTEAEAAPQKPEIRPKLSTTEDMTLFGVIKSLGGIWDKDYNPNIPFVIKKSTGSTLTEMGEKLRDSGYFSRALSEGELYDRIVKHHTERAAGKKGVTSDATALDADQMVADFIKEQEATGQEVTAEDFRAPSQLSPIERRVTPKQPSPEEAFNLEASQIAEEQYRRGMEQMTEKETTTGPKKINWDKMWDEEGSIKLMDKILAIEPQALQGALVSLRDLHKALPGVSKQAFDKGILKLAEDGKIHLHDVREMPPMAKPNDVIRRGDSYYIGFSIRGKKK